MNDREKQLQELVESFEGEWKDDVECSTYSQGCFDAFLEKGYDGYRLTMAVDVDTREQGKKMAEAFLEWYDEKGYEETKG